MKLIKPALAGILATTALLGTAIPAAAEGPESSGDDIKRADSLGSILFSEQEDIDVTPPEVIPPTDGEEPDGDLDPDPEDGGNETGQTGPLTIDYVSNFNFGEIEYNIVQGATQKAMLDVWKDESGNSYQLPNMVQVTDVRSTSPGWELKVTQEEQFETTSGTQLKGATITFDGNVTTKNYDGFGSPGAQGNELTPGLATKVAWADAATGNEATIEDVMGKGSSAIIFDGGVELDVPAGTQVELDSAYTTELTWTLENSPTFK